jgi:hypothetical protein
MGEIKSSWEIASEKVAKLGKLSPEEQRTYRENELRPVARMVADAYLGGYGPRRPQNELDAYKGEDREMIRGMALKQLIERIDLHNSSRFRKLRAGILELAVDKKAEGILHKVEGLINEYLETDEGNRQEIEKMGRDLLHQLRISGGAVRKINYKAKEEWRRKIDAGAVLYQKDIDTLKQELMQLN